MQEQSKKIKNIIYYLLFVFFAFILALSIAIPNGILKVFGYGIYRVKTDSMEPFLNVGDYVIIKKYNGQSLEDKDIILFNTKAQLHTEGIIEETRIIHYYGYTDRNGNIYTYSKSKYDLDSDDMQKYDQWGSINDPFYPTSDDVLGIYTLTINKLVFFVVIGTLIILILVAIYFGHRKHKEL